MTNPDPHPEHSNPEPNDPEYSNPEHSGPEHSDPEHSGPEHSDPEHSDPEHSGPENSRAEWLSENSDQAEDSTFEDQDEDELAKLFPSSKEEIISRTKRRKNGGGKGCLAILIILALIASGIGVAVWMNRDRIPQAIEVVQEFFGVEPDIDYQGEGTGELLFTITSGDFGSDIARNLVQQDIIMTERAFLELLYSTEPEPVFFPGVYRVAEQMSSDAALNALTNQNNRVENTALIREGITYHRALAILNEATNIPIEEFEAELNDLSQFGIPAEAPNIEGYLFPATYTFAPDVTAHEVIQILVNKMMSVLDGYGVAEEDRHEVLTMAGLIEREAGSVREDYFKVSRVFTNRLEQNWKLQSDATVHYGVDSSGTVWTNAADRADGSNPYNTYYHYGLPIGPISLPGDTAIDAALHPVEGDWMFFAAVNLRTGETGFGVTSSEHQANVNKLRDWCLVPENQSYCGR